MPLGEPAFAAVIPAYNASATIEATVASVLRQTIDDLEVVVVDDGSSDDTAGRARGFVDPRLKVIEQENRGPSAARNAGVAACSAPTVSFIDSDDLWLPTYLESMTQALDSQPDAGFAYTDAWVFDDGRRLLSTRSAMQPQRPPLPAPTDARAFLLELLERNFVYTSVTLRRELFLEMEGFDERLRYGEDFELWTRIVETGRVPIRASGTLAIHRRSGTSLTADTGRFYAGICDVYRLILFEHPLDAHAQTIAEQRLAYWTGQLARLQEPRVATRMLAAARRLARRRQWDGGMPDDVATTLSECGVT